MVSANGNQDLVNGNREGTGVVSTNFNQPQGIPEMGHHQVISSQGTLNAIKLLF